MSLNPGGTANYSWNFSNPDRDGYSTEITGTIVSLQEVQAREYNPNTNQPGRPRFWPDGNPVMNIRVGLALPNGMLKSITMMKAGKKQVSREKPSLHMDLYCLTNGNMMDLIGKTVHIVTWPEHPGENPLLGYYTDNQGQVWAYPWNTDNLKDRPWGQGNPRLYGVELVEGVKYELAMSLPDDYKVPELFADSSVQGGQPVPPAPQQIQQPVPQPNVMPMQGQYYAPPVVQPQYQQQMVMQPQPMTQPRPMPQPQLQYQQPQQPFDPTQAYKQTAPMPQGMDPAVAQAMQAVNAVNVQPVGDPYSIYDDDIPFA